MPVSLFRSLWDGLRDWPGFARAKYEFDIYLAYSSFQEEFVKQVAEQWQGQGLRVFYAPFQIHPGESIDAGLRKGLESSRQVVLFLTFRSIQSPWVSYEAGRALFDSRRQLIPVLLEQFEQKHIPSPIPASIVHRSERVGCAGST